MKIPVIHKLIEKCDKLDYIRILLENGTDVNGKDENGRTPLHHAVIHSQDIKEKNIKKTDIFDLLFEFKADPNIKDDEGQTPLHYVCRDFCQYSKIFPEYIELLLNNNADPNIADKKDRTCLYYLMSRPLTKDHVNIAKILLNKEVDLYNGFNSNYSPFYIFLQSYIDNRHENYMEIMEFLLNNKNVNLNIKFYVQNEDNIIGYSHHDNPIFKNINYETTPLMVVLRKWKNIDVAKKIIENNVDLTIKDEAINLNALEFACYNNYHELVSFIVEKLNDKKKENTLNQKKEGETNTQYDILQ